MWTMRSGLAIQFFFYTFLFTACLANLEQAGTQFITYNGTISGRFEHPSSAPSKCSDYYFDSLDDSFLRVGVNPPWDANPFYFSISHLGEKTSSHNKTCFNVTPGGCTQDAIYNLMFRTTDYLCYNDEGRRCSLVAFRYHFEPSALINLNESTTKQVDLNSEKGYRVEGDKSSFRNGSVPNEFDFQIPRNYSSHPGCATELPFKWNSTTPFTYGVTFTNTTAEAKFSLEGPQGTVQFSFTGKRVEARNNSQSDMSNNGISTPVSLNTSDPSMPRFNFVNGSEIHWKNSSRGMWRTTPSKSSAVSVFNHLGVLNWMLTTIIAVMVFL
ncbi:hypothetical protein N7492_007701 [Penicillium capsulatum]|uniref:Uncharacterized protein n=1 Tax=Penicillium capsulatum TaxID=69766 RepID=A0A9W9I1R2_9EURO|nr:hypothetical protein N7492_007701 [Penicillium capsulatum]